MTGVKGMIDVMMKRSIIVMVLMGLVIFALPVQGYANPIDPASEDYQAVQQACLDYVGGYFDGSAEKIKNGVHPDLVKRKVTSDSTLQNVTREQLITAAVAKKRDKPEMTVTVFDIDVNTAVAKVTNPQFFDYCELAKINGKWQVVNVLWANYPMK
jgi:hypothetical protein